MSGDELLDLRPNPGPENPPGEAAWAAWLTFLLLAGLATILLLLARRKRIWSALFPQPPAHVRALRQLDALARIAPASPAEAEQVYQAALQVLRFYLEDRFQIPALEQTSAELVQAADNKAIPVGQPGLLAEMLGEADLVRFARLAPTPEQTAHFLDRVRRLVLSTTPQASSG